MLSLRSSFFIVSLGLALAACGSTDPATPAATSTPSVPAVDAGPFEALVAIIKEIKADPDAYEAILARHDTTPAQLEGTLYLIARDPDQSRWFIEAME